MLMQAQETSVSIPQNDHFSDEFWDSMAHCEHSRGYARRDQEVLIDMIEHSTDRLMTIVLKTNLLIELKEDEAFLMKCIQSLTEEIKRAEQLIGTVRNHYYPEDLIRMRELLEQHKLSLNELIAAEKFTK
jgi:hypothetical protein